MAKRRKDISCNWQNVSNNLTEKDDIERRMKSIFDETKKLKNVVKFTRLENQRNSEELHFIRHHLNKISKTINIDTQCRNGESISMRKQIEQMNDVTNRTFKTHRDYSMPNGKNYIDFLNTKRYVLQ